MIIVNISPEYKYSKVSYKSPRDLNTILGFAQGAWRKMSTAEKMREVISKYKIFRHDPVHQRPSIGISSKRNRIHRARKCSGGRG